MNLPSHDQLGCSHSAGHGTLCAEGMVTTVTAAWISQGTAGMI